MPEPPISEIKKDFVFIAHYFTLRRKNSSNIYNWNGALSHLSKALALFIKADKLDKEPKS